MDERTAGIILRTRPLTETSLIVEWITPDLGRISTVAKGARRPKSPFLGKLDLFYEAEFSFARSRKSELHTLREVLLRNTRARLREELLWLHQGSYFAALISRATERETPVAEIYELLREFLDFLPSAAPNPLATLRFELKCLELLGYGPDLGELPPPLRAVAARLKEASVKEEVEIPLSAERQLEGFLKKSIAQSLEYVPTQRARALSLSA
jgi:DNA repair protein RecO (recombination protein O)